MCAREKAAVSGLAVCEEQSALAKIPCFIDWTSDFGWHARIGNGQQVQNVGLVLLIYARKLATKALCASRNPEHCTGIQTTGPHPA